MVRTRRTPLIIFAVITAVITVVLALQPAVSSATNFSADLLVTFMDEGTGWTILAKPGQQITQTFTVTVYSNVPATMRLNIYVGGELEYTTRQDVQFKFTKEIKTTKTADVQIVAQLEYGGVLKELTWEGTAVAKPAPIPKGATDYFTMSQVQHLIENLTMEWVVKALIFGAIGAGVAIITRYVFLLLQPWNGLHLCFIIVLIFAYYYFDPVNWIYYFIISVAIDFITYYFIKSADIFNILEPEVQEQNINLAGLPIYKAGTSTCVALQSSVEAIRRVFFNNHVVLKLNGPLNSAWTLNHTTPMAIANTARLEAISEEAEKASGEVVPAPKKEKRVFNVDLAAVHQFPSWDLVHRVTVFEEMSKKIEELTTENSLLKALKEAHAVKKAQEIAGDYVDKLYNVIFKREEGGAESEQPK